jgi:Anti-sigma-K factor rskA
MPTSAANPPDLLMDLLIKQATEGLTPEEERELDQFEPAAREACRQDVENACAAITLATVARDDHSAPPSLQAKLARDADSFFATTHNARAPRSLRASTNANVAWLAAAACLVLALFGWLRTPPVAIVPPVADVHVTLPAPVIAAPPRPKERSLADQRAALLTLASSQKVELTASKDPVAEGVTGDVVWDPVTQRGFLHLTGIKPNDRGLQQYQMWIFDGARDKHYPVPAGLFDVPADSTELIVPLNAALPIETAQAFAVTLEKPGGTVVPDLKHVVALGKVG